MEEFRDCLHASNLFDLSFRGHHFTWWNKQESNPIAKKIDRILVNDIWMTSFPTSFGVFGDPVFSDHCPSCINIGTRHQLSPTPFKFSNFLLHQPNFLDSLQVAWNQLDPHGTCMFRLAKKLKLIKTHVKKFSADQFSDIEKRVQRAHSFLIESQSQLLHSPSVTTATNEKEAHTKWLQLALAEESFFCQKSRVQWLSEGDRNTSFYHKMMTTRRASNTIHYLVDNSGSLLTDRKDIASHCVQFYSDLLGSSGFSLPAEGDDIIRKFTKYKCDNSNMNMLVAPFTALEVKEEFFSQPRNKSPGPDGFTSEFFKASWSIIGEEVTEAVLEFFNTGMLLKQWNSTAITLIPKTENASMLRDFRPISCCNVFYKVISKLLARRLQKLLPDWINPSQSAFVKGRLLSENVLLATEIMQRSGQLNTSRRGALKVDLRKAFDSVQWDFLIRLLLAANLPQQYVNWVKACITTPAFSISINGGLNGYFKGTNGLRQGDPLSPSLFVIAIDFFANLLEARFKTNQIGFHPKCKRTGITSLSFADDLLIFFDGKATSLAGINQALTEFHRLSGLMMNRDKTTIFTTSTLPEDDNAIAQAGFIHGTLPTRYLGLPLMHRKLRLPDYSPLLDKVRARLNLWANRSLTFAGRLQLLSSVIGGLLNFWGSTFILPKNCISCIERLCSRFLWKGDITKKGGAKVSWKHICRPKEEGGLGLRDFQLWNRALVLRHIWFIFSKPTSLWVTWIKQHRLKNRSFWNVKATSNSSWTWRTLLGLRSLASRFLRSHVKDGKTVNFWFDYWTPIGTLYNMVGPTGPLTLGITENSTVSMACDLNGWIIPARTRTAATTTLRSVLSKVSTPSPSAGQDYFTWIVQGSHLHSFSASKTWNELRNRRPTEPWAKIVWYRGHIPKFAFTFWVANLDRLPVRARLAQWGATTNACCFCCHNAETRNHLFFHCGYSSQVWHMVLRRLSTKLHVY